MSEVANAEVGGAGREEMVEDRQPDRSKDREPIEMLDVFMVVPLCESATTYRGRQDERQAPAAPQPPPAPHHGPRP